jgi:hypothetical protein
MQNKGLRGKTAFCAGIGERQIFLIWLYKEKDKTK